MPPPANSELRLTPEETAIGLPVEITLQNGSVGTPTSPVLAVPLTVPLDLSKVQPNLQKNHAPPETPGRVSEALGAASRQEMVVEGSATRHACSDDDVNTVACIQIGQQRDPVGQDGAQTGFQRSQNCGTNNSSNDESASRPELLSHLCQPCGISERLKSLAAIPPCATV